MKRGWIVGRGVLMPRGVGGHPFPQLQVDAGEWPVIAVAWEGMGSKQVTFASS